MAFFDDKKLMWDDPQFIDAPSSMDLLTKGYAQKLLQQSAILDHSANTSLVVLDLACGSGVVTESLHEMIQAQAQAPSSFQVICGDLADAMFQKVSRKIDLFGWTNTQAQKIDAQDTKLPDQHFTHVVTNFGPMLFPNPSAMLSECYRILQPGSVCAFSTWKRIGWVDDFERAFASMPELPPFNGFERMNAAFPGRWDDESYIKEQVIKHGFDHVQVETVSSISRFASVEEVQAVIRITISLVFRLLTPEERRVHANKTTEQKILGWFQERYPHGAVEWLWVALLTTSRKPEAR